MIQTAEGALNETHSILQRMRELSVQASNDTNNADDRKEIQKEVNQLTAEVNRIGNTTEFNTQKLLNGNKVGTAQPAGPVAATDATGTLNGITIDAGGAYAGAAGNLNVVISASSGATVGAAVSAGTLTITLDSDNAMDEAAIAAALTAGSLDSDFTLTGTGTVADGATTTLTGGAAASTSEGTDGAASLQIGANQGQQFSVTINDMRASALGIAGTAAATATGKDNDVTGAAFTANTAENDLSDVTTTGERALDVTDATKASAATKVLDQAIKTVSAERSRLGAYQNRLEHTINNLSVGAENLQAAESRIRDVDMAKEMMNFTKNNILNQAAQAMMSQSNQQPQAVLQLLR